MRRSIILIGALGILMLKTGFSFAQTMATNPVIWADVPDPDLIRVEDTYYMSSTTMYFNPGLPIMKSKDLVNWGIVSYCYSTLVNNNAMNLASGQEAYSGGSWASSINYHDGIFYVTTFSYTTGKTHIYKTTDIENGPWTATVLDRVFHDHTLFFDDDGRVFMAYGHDDIWLTELNQDLSGVKAGGVNKVIIPKASSVAGSNFILTAEGTRLQKINGIYYVSNICWPQGSGRTQILHRSNTIDGTYEGRVVFQSSIGSAQGEYIQTPEGKWYAFLFHDHGAVGRIPDLIPVTWSDGWPTLGVNGQVPATLDIPKGAGTIKGIVDSDEFSQAPPLKLQWQWNHNPNNNYWSLTERNGFLRLSNERTDANVLRTTNTLTQRSFGPQCSGYVAVDVSGMKDGDYAGLVALQNKYGFVGVKMTGTGKSIIMANATGITATTTEAASIPLNQNTVYLRIDMDFRNRTDDAYFYYSLDGNTWQVIGNKLDMVYDLEHFTGYRFGLFSYATKSTGGFADFDFFRVGTSIEDAQKVFPSVAFSSPAGGASFTADSDIALVAAASSPTGVIQDVKFYKGEILLHSDNTAPYSYDWTNVPAGEYVLIAVATDSHGNTVEDVVTVKVNIPQGPFEGNPHPIPGTIQLEEYDLGGNGFAYNDNSPGSETGVSFRTDEDVDIEECTDAGGGYNIGWGTAGEWLEYTVNVETPGTFQLSFRVAVNGDNRTMSVSMDGVDISGAISVPNTGGWQTWQTITLNEIDLSPGEKIMRLTIGETDFVNLNYLNFTLIKELVQEPYNGTPHPIPGRIEAEEYDLGGAGLAYHEFNANGNEGGATFRNDEVDIETTQDVSGNYNVGYILNGEWMEYTVDVAAERLYDLDLRVAADGEEKILHVEIDGVDVTGPVSVPNTGGWQIWETITLSDINLTEGEHVMRIVFDADYMNLNYVEFTDVVTGIDNSSFAGVKAFPNPFSDKGIQISKSGVFNYLISDLSGSVLEEGQGEDNCLVGKMLSPGIYFLTVKDQERTRIQKIVKQ